MKCMVLGGGGFLGTHLCSALVDAGYKVNILDRNDMPGLNLSHRKGVSMFSGDFLNPQDVKDAMFGCDFVFHMVSSTLPRTSVQDLSSSLQLDISGTSYVLEEARKQRVKKIVFLSSGGTVYGMPQNVPILEDHPTNPITPYGISKLIVEKYLHMYWRQYGLDYDILRIANAYGEGQITKNSQGVLYSFLSSALNHQELNVWGDGTVVRDYIHVEDIINALMKSIQVETDAKIFNIGTGRGHSLNDVIRLIEGYVKMPLKVKYIETHSLEVPVNILDASRANNLLDWQPKIALEDGILRTLEWVRHEIRFTS